VDEETETAFIDEGPFNNKPAGATLPDNLPRHPGAGPDSLQSWLQKTILTADSQGNHMPHIMENT
jgi:hypothetical protein